MNITSIMENHMEKMENEMEDETICVVPGTIEFSKRGPFWELLGSVFLWRPKKNWFGNPT